MLMTTLSHFSQCADVSISIIVVLVVVVEIKGELVVDSLALLVLGDGAV